MTKNTQEKIAEMESTLVDTVKVTLGEELLPTVDTYEYARAEVHDGALFVRYMSDGMYYTRIYAKGTWSSVLSSLSKERLILILDSSKQ